MISKLDTHHKYQNFMQFHIYLKLYICNFNYLL